MAKTSNQETIQSGTQDYETAHKQDNHSKHNNHMSSTNPPFVSNCLQKIQCNFFNGKFILLAAMRKVG